MSWKQGIGRALLSTTNVCGQRAAQAFSTDQSVVELAGAAFESKCTSLCSTII
jgi:hypothetical protein